MTADDWLTRIVFSKNSSIGVSIFNTQLQHITLLQPDDSPTFTSGFDIGIRSDSEWFLNVRPQSHDLLRVLQIWAFIRHFRKQLRFG